MMLKRLPLIFFFLTLIIGVSGQAIMPANLRATSTIDRLSTFQGTNVPSFLYGIPFPPGKVIGDSYLDTLWRVSTIQLYGEAKPLEGYQVRYDIKPNELEINAKNGIKVLEGNKVQSFISLNDETKTLSYFVNARDFKNEDNIALTGFFQILSDGTIPLLKKTDVFVKKADYNMALNVGSLDDKIMKKVGLYYIIDNKVYKMPSSKKKVVSLFTSKNEELEKFINVNSLSVTKEGDLIKIFEFYNSTVAN